MSSPQPSETSPHNWSITPLPVWWVDHEWGESPPVQPDDHSVLLLDDTQVRVAARHRCVRTVTRLLTREAVGQLSQVQLEWDPATARLELHTVAVWRGGERRDALVPERLLVRQQESEQYRGILTGRLTILLLLEDVRPGDVLEVAWSEVETAALEEAKYDLLMPLAGPCACGAWHLRVLAPKNGPVQWRTFGIELPPQITEWMPETLLEWSQLNRPGLEPEPMAPPWAWPVPLLQISQFSGWAAVAQCIHKAWARGREAAPAVEERARRIAAEHATLEDQVTAAIELVQSDVRYLGLSMGLDKLVPTTPDTVLRRLFGDCKDKSILLCALLRELGVKASPVLVHTRLARATGQLLPALHAFDHAIAAVEWEGRTVFIDGTMAGQGGRIHDRHAGIFEMGLIIAEDTGSLTKLPAPPRSEQPLTYTEEIYLSQSGKRSRIDWSLSGVGADADFLRNAIRAHGAAAFAMDELRAVQANFPHARRNGVEEIEDDVRENTYRIRGSYFMYDWGQRTSRHWNTTGINGRWAVRTVIVPPTDRKRTLPLRLNYPSNIRHEVRLHLNKISGLKPVRHTAKTRWFEYDAELSYRTSEVEIVFSWKTLCGEVTPAEYLTYTREVEAALKVTGITLTFPWLGPYHVEVPAAGEEPPREESGHATPLPALKPQFARRAGMADEAFFEVPAAEPAASAGDFIQQGVRSAGDGGLKRVRKRAPGKFRNPWRLLNIPLINLLWMAPALAIVVLIVIGSMKLFKTASMDQADERVRQDPRWTAASNAMTARNFTLVESILAELEKSMPGSPSVPALRSFAALNRENLEAAEAFAKEAEKRGPDAYMSQYARLELLARNRGKNEETLQLADRVIRMYPERGHPHFVKAKLLQEQGHWVDSAAEWKEGMWKEPNNYTALLSLRRAMTAAGKADEVHGVLAGLIGKHPAVGELRIVRIRMLLDQARLEEAKAEVATAAAFLGNHPIIQVMQAECALGGAAHNAALERIAQAANAHSGDAMVLFECARALRMSGHHQDVITLTQKIISVMPATIEVHLLLASSLQQTGSVTMAIGALEKILEVDPLEGQAWQLLGVCLSMSGEEGRAADCHAKAAALGYRN